MSLLIEKHAKYFQLCLHSLPAKAQSEDANKLALIYFVLHGLGLIGKLKDPAPEDIEYVYDHLICLSDLSVQAFRSSQTFQLDPAKNAYDLPNLSATFFALAILLVLRDDYSKRLDRHRIMNFVSKCQIKLGPDAGSFRPVLDANGESWGESDLRLCYIAASIRKMLGYDKLPLEERKNDFDVGLLTDFVLDKVNFNGGLASCSHTESHSGLTFCGLAALKLVGGVLPENWAELTKNWLVHRQVDYPPELHPEAYEFYEDEDIGGFNGRENKFADTCYSWWVLGSLKLLDSEGVQLVHAEKATQYLLDQTQHRLVGGFGKNTEASPDPFHSFLGLASLALLKREVPNLHFSGIDALEDIDEELVITKTLRLFMERMWE